MDILFQNIKNVYFLGIGGIGMSAIARYFKANNYRVGGYDRTESPLTKTLEKEGIEVNYCDEINAINETYRGKDTLVVYTPAIPEDNKQKKFFIGSGFKLYKRAEVLGILSRNLKALCVAGTHGKTTVTTMLAYLMHNSKVGCNAFLGGISMNYKTNLLLNTNSDYVVIEADEFDRSFLHLEPYIAAITAMDADHLDIYGTKENMVKAFEEYASKTRKDGKIFIKNNLKLSDSPVYVTYACDSQADCYVDNLRLVNDKYVFNYHNTEQTINDLILGIPGRVNVENACLAISIALEVGVEADEIRKALPDFKGVLRRFNIHYNDGNKMYIDDYAHHPDEIKAMLDSVKEMWPEKEICVIFQPHLYSRTNDFHKEFAKSLSIADKVVLLEIYPARELPIEGVDSGLIKKDISCPCELVYKADLIEYIDKNFKSGIILTVGAGDIDRLVPKITDLLNK